MVVVSYLVQYDTYYKDIITKYDGYFVIKCDKSSSQKRLVFYYQMRQFYYKMNRFYYKMQQLLQNVLFITQCAGTKVNYTHHSHLCVVELGEEENIAALMMHQIHA